MTEGGSLMHLHEDASYEELWFKLRNVVHMKDICEREKRLLERLETYVLIVVSRDEVQFTIDNRLFSLRRGAIFIGAPGQWFEYMGSPLADSEQGYMLYFDVQGNHTIKEKTIREYGIEQTGGIIPEAYASILLDLCEKAYLYWNAASSLEKFRSQAAFHEIVYNVLHQAAAASDQGLYKALEETKQYLDMHYHESLSLERLAQRIGVSARHFRRAFKQAYSISASDYLTDLRISQAKRLLSTTKHPIGDIARQVGYQDESHFRRSFKNQMGISPGLYVKNRQLKVAACSFPNIGQLLPLCIIPFAAPIDHDWTDRYRRKFHTEVIYPLHHNNEINGKTLRVAKPDRIIAIDAYGTAEFQEKLEEIAPVLVIPWRTKDWREHLRMTANFLDKSQEAIDWLAAYDDKADHVSEQWNRIVGMEKMLIVMIDRYNCYRWKEEVYDRVNGQHLPLAPDRHNALTDPSFERITLEQLSESDADRIVLLLSEDRHSLHTWNSLQLTENWKSLKAVRNNRIQSIAIGPWYEYTAYNHGAILDQALKVLIQKGNRCPKSS
ncbi:MAG: AraC family transcriptional regulator [Paenibacillus sp.]|nr:AraC family transcriptional regulator [Paenibacillus sp.]